ncbi:MAG TPA: flagellar assembly peptidoglycan hydrolase FlgJ [Rhodocyclaceae bacterium]|nr:flagellar assembly peptidoglycan hydrolase FlgJ [Rhodocyclaceae bacterium]
MSPADITPSIFDNGSLAALKRQTKSNDPAALKAAAQQFEALFLQMVLKSMHDATPRDGMFDSDQTRFYESLLDQQMSQVLATRGGGTGLAAVIERQLTQHAGESPQGGATNPVPPPTGMIVGPARNATTPAESQPLWHAVQKVRPESSDSQRDFMDRLRPHAEDASRATGVPANFMMAQAALETGWGRAEPRSAAGQRSYNVFGIKAGHNWNGPTVESATTEYSDGVAQARVERFRAYGSYAEAFRDYANLLSGDPRYAGVKGSADATAFAQGLSRAGYATDPAYAEKLTRIIGSLPRSRPIAT